jgi:hypothetical protein
LKKASAAIFIFLSVFVSGTTFARTQDSTGTIQGTVADTSGPLLDGATVYLSSPAMFGIRIVQTGKAGGFDFSGLPPGDYTLTAEMPGFQTLVREQIVLRAGMSFFFRLELSPTEKEGDVVTQSGSPALDTISSKMAAAIDQALLRNIPLARDFGHILNSAPGVLSPGYEFTDEVSILGGTARDNTYALDGANLTDLYNLTPLANLNIDLMEEIEMVSAGQPASQVPSAGSYVNVISKSGSNSFSGELGFFLISNGLNKDLWSSSQVEDLGAAPPGGDKNLFDTTLYLGGPFWTDRAWVFLSGRYYKKSRESIFIGPFQDVLSRTHGNYDWSRRDISGFFKLTVQPLANIKLTSWFTLADGDQPVAENPLPRLPFLSTHILDKEKFFGLYGALDYYLNRNTTAYVRGAYVGRDISTSLQADALDLAWVDNAGDAYGPLSGADYNSLTKRKRFQADALLRRFEDNILGAAHTLSLGGDFHDSTFNFDWWKRDNLLLSLDSRNPNGYFYPDRGLAAFWICGTAAGSTLLSGKVQHVGIFVADSFTFAGRLTFTLGLRFDRSWGGFSSGTKGPSGNPLSLFVGDAVVRPYLKSAYPDDFPDGLNPWGGLIVQDQRNLISWNAISPRVGFALDVWGQGKTILKASFSRYADDLSLRYLLPLHPLYPRNFAFDWLDANGDGQLDVEDEFSLAHQDLRILSGAFSKNRAADKIKAPFTEEISAGLEQQLFKDLTLGLHFIYRVQKNILEDRLYAPDTGEYLYAPDQAAAKKYWIPFTTTVPGTDSYPSQTLTLYARSLDAPPVFLQLGNVPELERKYQALEFSFHKRMAMGWQLAGSLVLSKAEGNLGGFADETAGLTMAADSPNFFVNRYGRLDTDRPVQIKLMGTVELPFEIWLSAFYHYQSGPPWQRWAQVLPPADWCASNNAERIYYTVNLEEPGSRREKAWSSLDLRLEKAWNLGAASRVGLYVDVTNLLGFKTSIVGLNDLDRWEPSAVGAEQPGRKDLLPDYGLTNALIGKRIIRFGFRLSF